MFKEISELKKFLTNNIDEYKPLPFWSWNDDLEEEKLLLQIRWMTQNNIGGFFMHARTGLRTPYMSPKWMECIHACAEYADELGLKAWAYDENGWPSGFAGGKLLENEANRDKYLLYSVGEYDENAAVCYFADEEKLTRTDTVLPGRKYLNIYIETSTSNADILNQKVVEQFIRLTHEEYKKEFGDQFPQKIRGFFTDEPQYQRSHKPYTDMLPGFFEKKYHVDILEQLGLLFLEKEGYREFRYRYWSALQELLLCSYAKTVYDWCIRNGVEFTGHYIEESSLGGQLMCCGGVMPFYEYMTMPGIDWLTQIADNEIPVRQLASVAAQTGKKRCLTESFAACGWEITPKELKRIADFQFLNGVNMLCHHLVPYSERGFRKNDHPAHYSRINPWVSDEFSDFNLYFARLGKLMSESIETVNVAVLHPIRSAYFDYKREEEKNGYAIKELDDCFKKDCRTLSASGVSYHFLDEVLLRKYGSVNGKKIKCGQCEYDFLVLPNILTMDKSTEKLLHEFAKNNGKILIMGNRPSFLEGEPFDYSYLESTCTLTDIVNSQPFCVEKPDHDLYYTYRIINGISFLMVQNASTTRAVSQKISCGQHIRSFKKLDLLKLEETNISPELTLQPGESVLCFPDTKEPDAVPPLSEKTFVLDRARVSFEENIYIIDRAQFSLDGVHFSKVYPLPGLFEKLLTDRYEGDLYLKYTFDLQKVPEQVFLNVEDLGETDYTINGVSVLSGTFPDRDDCLKADVTAYLKPGENTVILKRKWFQNAKIYEVLFGENITESLKNCIAYDSELQPVYLTGKFGVFSDRDFLAGADDGFVYGTDFYIGEIPDRVTEPVLDGLPFFSGKLTVRQKMVLDQTNVRLRINGTWQIAYVRCNGQNVGKLIYSNTIDVSAFTVVGENLIEIDFIIGNRNRFGPHHYCGPDENYAIAPPKFDLSGTWDDGNSDYYADHYNLLKLDVR